MAKRRGFDFYYDLCRKYFEENGNLSIPEHYKVISDGEEIKLGVWIVNTRRRKDNLSPDKIKKLDELGMFWGYNWKSSFELYLDYVKNVGVSNLKQWTTYKGVYLGQWVYMQKKRYRENTLSQDKIDALNEVGFEWNFYSDSKNEKSLEILRDYYKKNGHLLVKINEKYKDVELGKIVARFRTKYKEGTLSDEIIEELNNIGFEWDGNLGYWKHCYNLCMEYIENGGTITNFTEYNGFKIGGWLYRQQTVRRKGELESWKEECIDKVISNNPSNPWQRGFLVARDYFEEFGNLDIKEPVYKCFELKNWVDRQKSDYAENKLPEDKIKKLEGIEIKW